MTLKDVLKTDDFETRFSSNLVGKCCSIYNSKILREYTNEDLRLLIGQNIGLEVLVPFALDILEENIFSEGNLYPGDLLNAVVSIYNQYWLANRNEKDALIKLIDKTVRDLSTLKEQLVVNTDLCE